MRGGREFWGWAACPTGIPGLAEPVWPHPAPSTLCPDCVTSLLGGTPSLVREAQGRAGNEVSGDVGQIVPESGPGCTLRPRPARWPGGVVWLGLSGCCPVGEARLERPPAEMRANRGGWVLRDGPGWLRASEAQSSCYLTTGGELFQYSDNRRS